MRPASIGSAVVGDDSRQTPRSRVGSCTERWQPMPSTMTTAMTMILRMKTLAAPAANAHIAQRMLLRAFAVALLCVACVVCQTGQLEDADGDRLAHVLTAGKRIEGRRRVAIRLRAEHAGNVDTHELAAQHGFECLGPVGSLEHVYVFQELPRTCTGMHAYADARARAHACARADERTRINGARARLVSGETLGSQRRSARMRLSSGRRSSAHDSSRREQFCLQRRRRITACTIRASRDSGTCTTRRCRSMCSRRGMAAFSARACS